MTTWLYSRSLGWVPTLWRPNAFGLFLEGHFLFSSLTLDSGKCCSCGLLHSVRPDEGIKNSKIFPKRCPKSSHIRLYSDNDTSQMAQKVSRFLGYYCRKICHQGLSKIAQSGHTACICCNFVSIEKIL